VKDLLRGVVSAVSAVSAAGVEGDDGGDEGAEMVRGFGEVVEREIAEAEEEVVELGEEAVGVMKGIEKVSFGSWARGWVSC
jgi:hypothetical protein